MTRRIVQCSYEIAELKSKYIQTGIYATMASLRCKQMLYMADIVVRLTLCKVPPEYLFL